MLAFLARHRVFHSQKSDGTFDADTFRGNHEVLVIINDWIIVTGRL